MDASQSPHPSTDGDLVQEAWIAVDARRVRNLLALRERGTIIKTYPLTPRSYYLCPSTDLSDFPWDALQMPSHIQIPRMSRLVNTCKKIKKSWWFPEKIRTWEWSSSIFTKDKCTLSHNIIFPLHQSKTILTTNLILYLANRCIAIAWFS